jgi:hypothetical protein
LNTEEPAAWKEVKTISYEDYQISANDQGFLANDATWVHPGNIHDFDNAEDEETLLMADTSLIENGHPPLDSPEPELSSQRQDNSQFHTQAPGMMDPTQVRHGEEPEEKEFEWEATQNENVPSAQRTVEDEREESLEWEASPARPPRVGRMVHHRCDHVNFRMSLLQLIVMTKRVQPFPNIHSRRSKKSLYRHLKSRKRSNKKRQRSYFLKIFQRRTVWKTMIHSWNEG